MHRSVLKYLELKIFSKKLECRHAGERIYTFFELNLHSD